MRERERERKRERDGRGINTTEDPDVVFNVGVDVGGLSPNIGHASSSLK